MSNICACVSDRAAAVVADSMSYSDKERRKWERTQKLFKVRGSIVTGVGDSDFIKDYVNKLSQEEWKPGPEDLGKRVQDMWVDENKQKYEVSMFFLGIQKGRPRLYQFNSKTSVCTEIKPGLENYAVRGAGEKYMREAINRERNRGITVSPNSELTEMVDFMHNASTAARQDVHVNGELQFGFVGKNARILYDPDVIITMPPPEYVEKDGSINDEKHGKKGINDDAYRILRAYINLRREMKFMRNSAIHKIWNNVKPKRDPEEIIRLFNEIELMTRHFLNEYLKCDYIGYRQWIEDEVKDICTFTKKINKYKEDNTLAMETVMSLPDTKARSRYIAAQG